MLAVTRAVRLVRGDIATFDARHQRQCAMAVGGATVDDGVGGGGTDGADVFGLVFVRVVDDAQPERAYEGWFLDRGRFPDGEATPERGALFRTGTLEWKGERRWPSHRLGTRISVVAEGAVGRPADLELLVARRFTLSDVQGASPVARFQMLHALRPHRAAQYTPDTVEQPGALGVLYAFLDLGPGTDVGSIPPHLIAHKRSGVVFLRVRDRRHVRRVFEGWFWDKMRHPSERSVPRDGRLLFGGTTTPTGVGLERGRVRLDPSHDLSRARALGAGLAPLLANLRVTVPGRPWGSAARP
jgi:hypothetical protein